jgi:PKD repeat protein
MYCKKEFDFLVNIIQKPVARISAIYDSCFNGALYFNDSSLSFGSSKLVEWQWEFSDGRTSDEKNPQLQYSNYGVYFMQMRAINDAGCYADTVNTIGMYHRPAASFIVSGNACSKQDVFFKSTASVQGDELTAWQWSFSDKTTTLLPSLIKQFADSGNYEIKLIAKTKYGCADTAAQLVKVYKTPEISLPQFFMFLKVILCSLIPAT